MLKHVVQTVFPFANIFSLLDLVPLTKLCHHPASLPLEMTLLSPTVGSSALLTVWILSARANIGPEYAGS